MNDLAQPFSLSWTKIDIPRFGSFAKNQHNDIKVDKLHYTNDGRFIYKLNYRATLIQPRNKEFYFKWGAGSIEVFDVLHETTT